MKNKLPDQIISRPKKGFGIPLSAWLRTDLKPLCEKLLSEESLVKQGLFDKQFVNGIKERHYSGKENNRKLLWNLMIFQEWHNNFGG
jgi:asparagine synthase (glutamine-hydrolysing)